LRPRGATFIGGNIGLGDIQNGYIWAGDIWAGKIWAGHKLPLYRLDWVIFRRLIKSLLWAVCWKITEVAPNFSRGKTCALILEKKKWLSHILGHFSKTHLVTLPVCDDWLQLDSNFRYLLCATLCSTGQKNIPKCSTMYKAFQNISNLRFLVWKYRYHLATLLTTAW
jgi:hypothetical protein